MEPRRLTTLRSLANYARYMAKVCKGINEPSQRHDEALASLTAQIRWLELSHLSRAHVRLMRTGKLDPREFAAVEVCEESNLFLKGKHFNE